MTIGSFSRPIKLIGPALATGIAYIDPGNVATNLTGGARFHYQLLWVIILATVGAFLVQYLSAKVAIASGQSLPQIIGSRIHTSRLRILYWIQAEVVVIATELAEIVGGAIALQILFGLNPIFGSILVGLFTYLILGLTRKGEVGAFIYVVSGLIFLTIAGFIASLFTSHINFGLAAHGLVPHISQGDQLYVALGMIGATIMPHAIHCHSGGTADRHGKSNDKEQRRLLHWAGIDVAIAMILAGSANIVILIVGAINVYPDSRGSTIQGSVARISQIHGNIFGTLFALGLLASSLASSAIGGYAGSSVMQGLLKISIKRKYRAILTILPAVVILSFTKNSTDVLIDSQITLTFGLPLALAPLIWFTSERNLMGKLVNGLSLKYVAGFLFLVLLGLNLFSLGSIFSS